MEIEEQQLPTTIEGLIEWLEETYPDKIVTRELSPYEQGYQNGVINLIRTLRFNYLEREE